MRILSILALVALASCGVDGEPVSPFGSVGVGVGSDGVSTSATVGAKAGNVSVAVGF